VEGSEVPGNMCLEGIAGPSSLLSVNLCFPPLGEQTSITGSQNDVQPRQSPKQQGQPNNQSEVSETMSANKPFLFSVDFLRYSVTATESWPTQTHTESVLLLCPM
jgi:hypothetical protein